MQIRKLLSLVLAGIMVSASSALPQDPLLPSNTGRPKLGLVLEGGGALGLAHIGVIQWMEEHRIPVSYVAGTSMGGWSADSMRLENPHRRCGRLFKASIGTRC